MEFYGSTSSIERVSPGVVVKKAHPFEEDHYVKRFANNFSVERQILERLGHHPRIVRYLGMQGNGILLGEASHGNLQTYIDQHHASTSVEQRLLWCRQLAEAIAFIHSRGVIHSDLRPGNILVHETVPGARDLLLADFGGSVCKELGLDGLSLPDGPFYSPVFQSEPSTLLDIFGMGSIFYTIHTGRWAYKPTPGRFENLDERLDWEEKVAYPNFLQDRFPEDVKDLPAGDVILACWKRKYEKADDALAALDKYLEARGEGSPY
ncbi:03c5b672-0cb1-4235-902a-289b7c164780 [Thermothielavioides terrestris]|uniref:EKC/KEOPS complex subunit BUD32 n=1 Tax=Thermothielavioides terrestris TaxID=2587410 RepID=A0A3S4BK30_9PEZI|nr:03c5b672-0cb1-4235-902a-289b7c164780 [Thermothielavioides terrestris]